MDCPRALYHQAIPRQQTQKSIPPRLACSANHGEYWVTEDFRMSGQKIFGWQLRENLPLSNVTD
jgi:hypothetical protein